MDSKENKLNLWNEYIQNTEYLSEENKEIIGLIAEKYTNDISFLIRIYEAFVENERFLEDEENQVVYERDGEDYILTYDGKECIFNRENFRKILISMIDILEDTLPLGTVVDLKKSAYKGVEGIDKIDNIRMVITYRFLCKENSKYYFPYAGVVYPIGMMGKKEVLYFTSTLIDKVIHKGFSDDKERAYVYLMKQELIVQKGMNTFGYANEDEILEFNNSIKNK